MSDNFSEFDIEMTRRAIELAACGVGQVSPSPLVGCVIVDDSGETVGEGCYIYDGVEHAEAVALRQAGKKARGATAYVSLEPHHHHSRTPPCTKALLKAGIRRIVCPIEDPNPLVAGKGFAFLRTKGVEVLTGVLKEEAARQNEKYIHWHKTAKPFVHLKTAISLDGRIATRTGDSRWITNEESRQKSHDLRHEYDAILIGANTAAIDNPTLTDRSGKPRRRPLARVVLDNRLNVSLTSNLVLTAEEAPVIIFTSSENSEKIKILENAGIEIVRSGEGGRNLPDVLTELGKRTIQSVIVEGGATIAGAFCDAKLIDKVTFFIAPTIIGGTDAPLAVGGIGASKLTDALHLKNVQIERCGTDLEVTAYPASMNTR